MDDAHTCPQKVVTVTRDSEFTRLERELLATAYERVLPIHRRPLAREREFPDGWPRNLSDSFASRPVVAGA